MRPFITDLAFCVAVPWPSWDESNNYPSDSASLTGSLRRIRSPAQRTLYQSKLDRARAGPGPSNRTRQPPFIISWGLAPRIGPARARVLALISSIGTGYYSYTCCEVGKTVSTCRVSVVRLCFTSVEETRRFHVLSAGHLSAMTIFTNNPFELLPTPRLSFIDLSFLPP